MKDWEGQPIYSGVSKGTALFDLPNIDALNEPKLSQETDKLKTKQKDYFTQLSAVNKAVEQLKNVINECDIQIKEPQLDQRRVQLQMEVKGWTMDINSTI